MCGAVQAMDSSMGGGGPLPDLMSAGTPSSRRDAHEADCTPETATRGQGGQMPPQPRRAEPLEGAHVMCPLFDAASTASQQSPASQQDGAEGADDALCALIKLIWPDAPVLFCKALYELMTKGSSVKYCGTVAKKGADSQQRWLGLKSAVMCNSQLLASAAGGGTDSRAALPQKFVDTKSPEFRGLLTAFVSLGLEFQENHVGSSPDADNLLFFKRTREAPGEHGLANMHQPVEQGDVLPTPPFEFSLELSVHLERVNNVSTGSWCSCGISKILGPFGSWFDT